jgi:hypothetical protein
MSEEERILAEEMVKAQGIKNLMSMAAVEDMTEIMAQERDVIDRDYRHNEEAIWGAAPDGEPSEDDDDMRIMAAGNVTFNQLPPEKPPETPPEPAIGGSEEPETSGKGLLSTLRAALLPALLVSTFGLGGLVVGYGANYLLNRGSDDTDTTVELGLGKIEDYLKQ